MGTSRFNKMYSLKTIERSKPKGNSKTIPNDNYSVKELIQRMRNGSLPPSQRQAFYDEIDPDKMLLKMRSGEDNDLVDIRAAAKYAGKTIKDFQRQLEKLSRADEQHRQPDDDGKPDLPIDEGKTE